MWETWAFRQRPSVPGKRKDMQQMSSHWTFCCSMQNMNYYEKDYEDDYAFAVSTKWKEEKSRKRYEVFQ